MILSLEYTPIGSHSFNIDFIFSYKLSFSIFNSVGRRGERHYFDKAPKHKAETINGAKYSGHAIDHSRLI
jgi:hypothetical protein